MSNQIEVSIVIPCFNEENFIAKCLDSILISDFPKDKLEILVIDGLSTDRTPEILRQYAGKHHIIKLFDNPGRIPPIAVNIGIKNSIGDVIVRMDAHSEYPASYVTDCLKLLHATRAGNAGGRVVNIPNGTGVWAVPIAFVTSNRFGVGGGAFRTGRTGGFVDTVPFGTFRREIFVKVGYFDERLSRTEDNEFNARLRKAGYKIAFDPKIEIRYKNQATLGGLLLQAFYNGMWTVYELYLHPYTFQWRRFVPPLFFFYLVVLSISFLLLPADAIAALSLPVSLYLTINSFVSWGASKAVSLKLRVFLTFFLYHFVYGAGTFWGIFNLVIGRWNNYSGKPVRI